MLHLQTGEIVQGKNGGRARIVMPPGGLTLTADRVRFENIDFVWHPKAEEITSPDQHALVALQASHAEFEKCTFQAEAVGSFELPAAIRIGNQLAHVAPLAPAAEVQIDNCVLQEVACAVDCQAHRPAAINLHNTLYLGPGPLVKFSQGLRTDAPSAVTLQHVTARGVASVIELHSGRQADTSGTVTLTTTDCVLAPSDSGALAVFVGPNWPKSAAGTFAALEWNGQDSLVAASIPSVVWQHGSVKEPLPDEALPIEGLVASPFDFVGPASGDPANSHLRHWLAPGRTELPPGIGEGLPPLAN
jgi:hypothetical protein